MADNEPVDVTILDTKPHHPTTGQVLSTFAKRPSADESSNEILVHLLFLMGPLVCFVCGISLTSGQLISELFPDCCKVMLIASCFTPQGQ